MITQRDVYLGCVLEAWYDGLTTEYAISSSMTCGITTALDGSVDRLIRCLQDGDGNPPNGCYKLVQKREKAEADDLAQVLAGFELDLDEDDVGNEIVKIVKDQPAEGNSNGESEFLDNSDFCIGSSYIVH